MGSYKLPLVVGYPLAVLVYGRINQRAYTDACLDAGQLPVTPQATSESPFLLRKHNDIVLFIVLVEVQETIMQQ